MINFAIVKRSLIIKLLAVPMVIVYMMAVIGFDIHSCSDNGSVYVESLLSPFHCHPHDCHCSCHEEGCCHHERTYEACGHFSEKDCCSDVLGVLNVCSDEQQYACVPPCIVVPVFAPAFAPDEADFHEGSALPGILLPHGPGVLQLTCVMRV